jgi:hypothetical protein
MILLVPQAHTTKAIVAAYTVKTVLRIPAIDAIRTKITVVALFHVQAFVTKF